jgi:hypothetical protein
MATLYRINNWAENFENHRTRELVKLQFVCVPNKQDGDGYTELLDHENGAAHYGAWIAIVLVASKNGKAETRGMLVRDSGQPHDSRSLARMTRIDRAIFDEAIPRLVAIGWLSSEVVEGQEDAETSRNPAAISRNPAEPSRKTALNGMEGNGKEGMEGSEGNGSSLSGSQANADRASQVRQVFDHYRTHHPRAHKEPVRTSKEWKAIEARLREGYAVGELCEAIDGCHKTPHNIGQNDRQQTYLGLELIMRSGDQVTRFIEANSRDGPVLSGKSQQAVSAIDSLMRKEFG